MQDEEELSYAIKPLGNALFPTHALCPKCNEVKPIKQFKTKSTNAQAIAWGYKRAIEITTEHCSKCRRPKKKIADLTLKELHNKIASGDIAGGVYGQMLKEDKRAEGIRKKKEGVINRWKKIRAEMWSELLTGATAEYDRIRKQHNLKEGGQHPELHTFLTQYLSAIKLVRSVFIEERKLGRRSPAKNQDWVGYMSKSKKEKLIKLWTACPQETKINLYEPTILNNRLTTEKE